MLKAILRHFVPLAVVITALCGLGYVVGQQVLRQLANDPQIQLAQDTAARLSAGEPLASVVPTTTLDLGRSLAPFIIVYDDQGKVLAATGQLHGQPPALPAGVLDGVRPGGEDVVSWQPEPTARFAAVIEHVTGAQPGFVLVARSLDGTEDRITRIEEFVGAAWLATLAATLVAVVFVEIAFKQTAQ